MAINEIIGTWKLKAVIPRKEPHLPNDYIAQCTKCGHLKKVVKQYLEKKKCQVCTTLKRVTSIADKQGYILVSSDPLIPEAAAKTQYTLQCIYCKEIIIKEGKGMAAWTKCQCRMRNYEKYSYAELSEKLKKLGIKKMTKEYARKLYFRVRKDGLNQEDLLNLPAIIIKYKYLWKRKSLPVCLWGTKLCHKVLLHAGRKNCRRKMSKPGDAGYEIMKKYIMRLREKGEFEGVEPKEPK